MSAYYICGCGEREKSARIGLKQHNSIYWAQNTGSIPVKTLKKIQNSMSGFSTPFYLVDGEYYEQTAFN